MVRTIIFTGGGTAGHVMPNIPLMAALTEKGWKVHYVGSKMGIENRIITSLNIPFYSVQSGKLRRYMSFKNFIAPFQIFLGIFQSFWLLKRLKPRLVFSKGGFVAFPVVVAAWLRNIPVIAHESDFSPGLANRLSYPFVQKICVTFEDAKKSFKDPERVCVTGTPIRGALLQGSREEGMVLSGFDASRPCLLVIGGSLGSDHINHLIREALPILLKTFQVIHICGKNKVSLNLKMPGYYQVAYADCELAHYYALADLIISRSGANVLYEILALRKPHVLIPLSRKHSRGDQIQNARFFEKKGMSIVLDDDTVTSEKLIHAVSHAWQEREGLTDKINELSITSGTEKILTLLEDSCCFLET